MNEHDPIPAVGEIIEHKGVQRRIIETHEGYFLQPGDYWEVRLEGVDGWILWRHCRRPGESAAQAEERAKKAEESLG